MPGSTKRLITEKTLDSSNLISLNELQTNSEILGKESIEQLQKKVLKKREAILEERYGKQVDEFLREAAMRFIKSPGEEEICMKVKDSSELFFWFLAKKASEKPYYLWISRNGFYKIRKKVNISIVDDVDNFNYRSLKRNYKAALGKYMEEC